MGPACSLQCSQEPAASPILFIQYIRWKHLNISTRHNFRAELLVTF
jgi:hypothetical protein